MQTMHFTHELKYDSKNRIIIDIKSIESEIREMRTTSINTSEDGYASYLLVNYDYQKQCSSGHFIKNYNVYFKINQN